ncbi:MAG: FAD:protein FMN transferase [Hydrogenothermaceae bacterium]|nr:FAD:protein FMN transferase [Hydrogenothermaceae bacterium]
MAKFVLLALVVFNLSFSGEKVFNVMGTYMIVDTPSYQYDIYRYVSHLDGLLSDYKEDSEITRLNSSSGKDCVDISRETLEVLKKSIEVSELTFGAFDVTVGAITINYKRKGILSFQDAKRVVNYRDLKIDGSKACLLREGMAVDLGGIGKGYTVQKAYEKFRDKLKKGFISIAGDLKVWGQKRSIGVYNPITKGVLAKLVNRLDVCLSTSGNYFQDHIIGNQTDILQITVAGDDCGYVDAISTAIFAMDRDIRAKFLRDNNGFGVLILYKDGSVWFNKKFSEYFSLIQIGE